MNGQYAYTPQIWSSILMAVLMIALSVYSVRRRSVPGAIPLMVASLLAAVWAAGSSLEYTAVDMPTKIAWSKVQAAVQVPIAIAINCFIREYAWPGRWLTRRNLALLTFPGVLSIFLILTEGYHHLMWIDFTFADGSIKPQFGPGSWFFLFYSFVLLELINLFVFGWLFWHSPQHRWPVVLILVGQFAGRTVFLLDRLRFVSSYLPLDLAGMSLEFLLYAIVLLLAGELEAPPRSTGKPPLVVIDEVQKVPSLLDVVQDIIDRARAQFILTGSSARKLRRGNVNMLPGRLVSLRLDPFTMAEQEGSMMDRLLYGALPGL